MGEINKPISALDKLYNKYSKTDSIYPTPEDINNVDFNAIRLKSPFLSFDRYLGGAPAYGKITVYSALASAGKTSLALAFAGYNKDKTIGFVDAEYNWNDASYLWIDKYFGIEKDRIHILHPTFLEEGAEMIEDLCDVCDIVIYDGFDSISPKGEYEATMYDNSMGLQARAYKKFFRRSMGKIYRSKAALIITNHLYENIGNTFEPLKEAGGKAIRDYSSQTLFMYDSKIKDGTNVVGQKITFEVKKDKLSGNKGTKFHMEYNNDTGFNIEADIIENAVDLGIIKKNGSWFSYYNDKFQGIANGVNLMIDNPEFKQEVYKRCLYKINNPF